MNSKERHEHRRERRQQKRDENRKKISDKPFDEVFNFSNLTKAGKRCCNGTRWKTSTIHFETFLLREALKALATLRAENRKFDGFHSFTTIEHGKKRDIDALPIDERMMQKCFCNYFLTDAYSRSFILDNSASMKGRGMDFALKRLKKHLSDHYRKYGLQGGIYQFDFKSYFASIPHEELKRRARKIIGDDKLYRLMCSYIDDFQRLKAADKNAEVKRGVGLGSEVSQILALDFASPVDHYIKDYWGIKGYGRYNDDGYIISDSLEKLEEIRFCLFRFVEALGIKMNVKKNIITPFKNHSFTFLKLRFHMDYNGKITMRLGRKSIKAMRRKLKIFRKWVNDGVLSPEDVFASYQSWRAHARRCDSYKTLRDMDELFVNLFSLELEQRKKAFPCTLRAVYEAPYGWRYYQKDSVEPKRKEGNLWGTTNLFATKTTPE